MAEMSVTRRHNATDRKTASGRGLKCCQKNQPTPKAGMGWTGSYD